MVYSHEPKMGSPQAPTTDELRAYSLAASHDSVSLTSAQHELGQRAIDLQSDVVIMTASDTLAMQSDMHIAHGP